mmetsp:Transcript_11495/g.16964  ORF Transcript_11495/g.16964 Transcript_11495/m.16964 type:complete len:225 (-) Transcript_11495:97-771(-)
MVPARALARLVALLSILPLLPPALVRVLALGAVGGQVQLGPAYIALPPLGVDAVLVLGALGADVALLLAQEAHCKAHPIPLLRSSALPQSVLRRTAVVAAPANPALHRTVARGRGRGRGSSRGGALSQGALGQGVPLLAATKAHHLGISSCKLLLLLPFSSLLSELFPSFLFTHFRHHFFRSCRRNTSFFAFLGGKAFLSSQKTLSMQPIFLCFLGQSASFSFG